MGRQELPSMFISRTNANWKTKIINQPYENLQNVYVG